MNRNSINITDMQHF